MKRIIKFRAFNTCVRIICDVHFIDLLNREVEVLPFHNIENGDCEIWDFKDIELMQWSGFKDKKGIDIYEGDILDNSTGKYIGVVEFKNGCFQHRKSPLGFYVEDGMVPNSYNSDDVELEIQEPEYWAFVIGNIYQNPELINQPK